MVMTTAEHDKVLLRVIARACRRRTLVVTPWPEAVTVRRMSVTAQAVRPAELGDLRDATPFDTVVVLRTLERLAEPAGDELLDAVRALLAPHGRLIVCVPNGHAVDDPAQVRVFSARSLRHLLRGAGRPKALTEQPYRWLAMYVDAKPDRATRTPAGRLSRYRVISRLCRGRVIELGCGAGELTAAIAARGLDAIGVDISRRKIEAARERYPHLRFEREDICRTSAAPASFDTAVLAEVLEHVDDGVGARMLAAAWRLLRPGGRLVVSVPNENCIPHPNHIRTFDCDSFRTMLRPLGVPRVVTDQPYKWLLMYVDKAADGAARDLPRPSVVRPEAVEVRE